MGGIRLCVRQEGVFAFCMLYTEREERRLLCGVVHCESFSRHLPNFQKVTNIVKHMGPSGVCILDIYVHAFIGLKNKVFGSG